MRVLRRMLARRYLTLAAQRCGTFCRRRAIRRSRCEIAAAGTRAASQRFCDAYQINLHQRAFVSRGGVAYTLAHRRHGGGGGGGDGA